MVYLKGEEVLRDKEPFVHMIFPNFRKLVCDSCVKKVSEIEVMKPCDECKMVYYCNKTCQSKAWTSHHKYECQHFRRIPLRFDYITSTETDHKENEKASYIILCLRVMLKLKYGEGEKQYYELPTGQKRFYSDLMCHVEKLKKFKPETVDAGRFYYKTFEDWLGEDAVPFSKFLEIHSKLSTNTHNMVQFSCELEPNIGSALYLGASAIDHSCQPNALWINNGKELVLRTISEVEEFSDLRVPYIGVHDLCNSTDHRQIELHENYWFECKCPRCESKEDDAKLESYLCKNCQGMVNSETKICSDCNTRLEFTPEEKQFLNDLYDNDHEGFDLNETLFKTCVKIFHPANINFHGFFQYEIALDFDDKSRLQLLTIKLAHFKEYLPEYFSEIGKAEFDLAKQCDKMGLFEEGQAHIRRAEEIFVTLLGPDHPCITNEIQPIKLKLARD